MDNVGYYNKLLINKIKQYIFYHTDMPVSDFEFVATTGTKDYKSRIIIKKSLINYNDAVDVRNIGIKFENIFSSFIYDISNNEYYRECVLFCLYE